MSFYSPDVKVGDIVTAKVFRKIESIQQAYCNMDEAGIQKFCIQAIRQLDTAAYDQLVNSFLDEREWLADCKGTAGLPRSLTNLNTVLYVSYAYLIVCEERSSIVIDSQGYSYARYVGVALQHGTARMAEWLKAVDRLWDNYINQINQAYNQLCSTAEQNFFINLHDADGYNGWWKGSIYTGFNEDIPATTIAKNLMGNQFFLEDVKRYEFSCFSEQLDKLLEAEKSQKNLFSTWWKLKNCSGLTRDKIEQQLKDGLNSIEILRILNESEDFLKFLKVAKYNDFS